MYYTILFLEIKANNCWAGLDRKQKDTFEVLKIIRTIQFYLYFSEL